MPRYIALLRAINVGGHVVKMDHLRRLFEALEFSNVETFIASGNVIFESPARSAAALEKKIGSHLRQHLGYDVATFLRTPAELAEIARYQPFPNAEGGALYVAFLAGTPTPEASQKVRGFSTELDAFEVRNRELYWYVRDKLSASTFSGGRLEKTLGLAATMRNVTTVRKLAAKYPP
jgi:uncharacterized protein (DUF1697 family)